MAEIIQLMDGTETEEWLPVTNTAAVYDDDGNRLDNTLSSLTNKKAYFFRIVSKIKTI